MGLLIDGIIGPVLETFGVIEVDENGEWTRKEHDTTRKEYQKKEREDKESLWERLAKWVKQLKDRTKKERTPRERYRAAVRKNPEELKKSISEAVNDLIKENEKLIGAQSAPRNARLTPGLRTRNVSKEKLRKISRFEGKVLAANDSYRLWYGDHFPYDDEVEEGVVYVVQGQGEPISRTGILAEIKQDAYYVWDKTNETFEKIGTTPPKETLIDEHTGEITVMRKNDGTRWRYTGVAMYDPNKNYVIYPNTVDDYDDETPDGMRPWGIL